MFFCLIFLFDFRNVTCKFMFKVFIKTCDNMNVQSHIAQKSFIIRYVIKSIPINCAIIKLLLLLVSWLR